MSPCICPAYLSLWRRLTRQALRRSHGASRSNARPFVARERQTWGPMGSRDIQRCTLPHKRLRTRRGSPRYSHIPPGDVNSDVQSFESDGVYRLVTAHVERVSSDMAKVSDFGGR